VLVVKLFWLQPLVHYKKKSSYLSALFAYYFHYLLSLSRSFNGHFSHLMFLTAKSCLLKLFQKCCFRCFKSQYCSMMNPELTSSTVLVKDQHVKVCFRVGCLLGVCLKLDQTLNKLKTWIHDTMCIFHYSRTNSDMPFFWGPTASLHGQQCRRQCRRMISYSQTWRSFPFYQRNCCACSG
jgi:hypothetical protein